MIAYLRSSSSVDKLLAALRDFAGMVEAWWVQRRAGTGAGVLLNGAGALVLAPAVAASLPPAKRQMLEFVGQSQPAGGVGGHEQQQQQPETRQPQTVYRQPQLQAVYVQPEVITHPILTGGRLVLETSALPLLGTDGSGELQMVGAAAGAYLQNMTGPINDHMVGHHQPAANGSADDWRAAAAAAAVAGTGSGREDGGGRELQKRPDSRRLCALNVGGHLFLTTTATLLSFEGSYFWKLVQSSSTNDSSRRGAHHEFFIDRNGKVWWPLASGVPGAPGAQCRCSQLPACPSWCMPVHCRLPVTVWCVMPARCPPLPPPLNACTILLFLTCCSTPYNYARTCFSTCWLADLSPIASLCVLCAAV